jgi:hypothetical protein
MTRHVSMLFATSAALAVSAGVLFTAGGARADSCPNLGGVQVAILAEDDVGGPVVITTEASPGGEVEVTANPPSTTSSVGIIGCTNEAGTVTITTNNSVLSYAGTGIEAYTVDGAITIDHDAGEVLGGAGMGIFADAQGTGSISITTAAGTDVEVPSGQYAVLGSSQGGDVSIDVEGTADGGVLGTSIATGAVAITIGGALNASAGNGVSAISVDGGASVSTAAGSTVFASAGDGVVATASGAGDVSITNHGAVAAGQVGLDAQAAGAGAVSVYSDGGVTGAEGAGVIAQSTSGADTVDIAGGSVTSGGLDGILATSTSGAVSVTTAAGTAVVGAPGSFGIAASSTLGGAVSVVADGAVIGGVEAGAATAGTVAVTVGGQVTNAGGPGIETSAATGATTLQIAAGGGVTGAGVGVQAASAGGLITLGNGGDLSAGVADHSGAAVSVSGTGGLRLTNAAGGWLDGRLTAADHVAFTNAGLWQFTGVSDFGTPAGAADNSLTNVGMIQTAFDPTASATTTSVFADLGAFHNGSSSATGVLTMMNGLAGDVTQVSGLFTGATGHSVLGLDAFLGGPGSKADELQLSGGSAGQTMILINDTNRGAGAINLTGIVLVTGVSHSNNFVLDPATPNYDHAFGGIDHGFFLYRLNTVGGTAELTSQPNLFFGQLPGLLQALRQIFDSAGFGFPFDGNDHGRDRLALAGDGAETPRMWMDASNWRPGVLTERHSDLWASQLPGGSDVLAASVEVGQSFLSRSSDSAEPSLTMDAGYGQSTASLVSGFDLVRRRAENSAFVAGLLSGYVQSDQSFRTGGDSVAYSGPIVGAYSSYSTGALRLDADVRADLLKATYLSPLASAASSGAANVFGAELDATYSRPLGQRWTVAPVASVTLASASLDGLSPMGEAARFSGGQSAQGAMGVRLAGDLSTADWRINLAASAKVSDEFAGVDSVAVDDAASDLALSDRLGGVTGDFVARLDLGRKAGGFNAFVSGGYRLRTGLTAAVVTSGLVLAW